MSSPSKEQAKLLRLARTRARTTLSDIKRIRASWDQVVKEGRACLEEACNVFTRLWMWPRLVHDSLNRCSNLLPVGMTALRRQYITEREGLRECQQKLEVHYEHMCSAMETLEEAIKPIENKALFTCFTARDFHKLLNGVVCPYEAQIQVCSRIVKALPRAAELFDSGRTINLHSMLEKPQVSFIDSWDQKQAHAMVVTWMLQTKLDSAAMESTLQLLSEDVRTI